VPGASVRQVVLTSFRDTCNGGDPRLAWAVVMQWAATADNTASPALPTHPPRAIVIVDATSGDVIASQADQP
jgi:D-alanyl-D-alanine carboxypeptidase